MLYDNYRRKVVRIADIWKVIKRFRVLIILVLAAALAVTAALLCVRGIVYDVAECPAEISYGEQLGYSADAVFGNVRYEYSKDGQTWSETQPVRAGSYRVRAVSKDIVGNDRYGKVYSFTILPKAVAVTIDQDSIRFGETPSVSADLAYGDVISCSEFLYEDITARSTEVIADQDAISIVDENGEDVTSSYLLHPVAGIIDFEQRQITVNVQNASGVYDGNPLAFDGYELDPATPLAEGDHIVAVFDDSIVDAGQTENVPQIRIYRDWKGGKVEVTGNYLIDLHAGTLTMEKRPITIATGSASKVYDGTSLSSQEFSLADGSTLADGHTIEAVSFTSAVAAGITENILSFGITDENGEDVTSNYSVFLQPGTLSVEKRAVSVFTADGAWVYDGTAHTNAACGLSSSSENKLVRGHTLSAADFVSVKDVGSAENTATASVLDGAGVDVTANYEIEYEFGTLEITARPVVIRTEDATWVYDGAAHTHGGHGIAESSEYGLAEGHTSSADTLTEIVCAGTADNAFAVKIFDGGEDVTSNYALSYEYGTLTVTPRPITVKADDAEKMYDAAPLTCGTVSVVSEIGLVEGHILTAGTQGSRTDAGTGVNSVAVGSVRIADASGADMTANYEVFCADGALTVTPRPITVKADDAEKMYDGMPLTCGTVSVISEIGLVEGHTLTAGTQGSRTDAGEGANSVAAGSVRIADASGADVTANYAVFCADGALTVTPRPVTVATASGTWVYDGTLHSKCAPEDYWISGNSPYPLVDGHVLSALNCPARYYVGTSVNSIMVDVFHAGANVTANYQISYEYGTLEVTPRPITVKTSTATKIYNGVPLQNCSHGIAEDSPYGLVSGHLTNASRCAQITDAGTIENTMLVSVFDGYGTNVSGNYQISYEYGTLTVTPRPITVKADDAEKVYDGTPLTCNSLSVVSEYKLVVGHILTAGTEGSQTEVGASANRVTEGSVKIVDGDGTDVLRNYAVSLAEGTLTVTPRAITVKADDAEKVYDGTPLTCETVSVVSEYKLVAGHILAAETEGSRTEVGVGANRVTEGSVKIADGNGADVTKNYSVNYQDGTLTVRYPGTLAIRTHDAQKVYDGTPLTCSDYEIVENTLGEGFEVQVGMSSGITNVGEQQNICTVTVMYGGKDVTGYIRLETSYGMLTVLPRPITVATGSASWEYDGEPHSCEEFELRPGELDGVRYDLLEGHTGKASDFATITDVGQRDNRAAIAIADAAGADVTSNYQLSFEWGTLEIIGDKEGQGDEEGQGTAGDLDTSGVIGGGSLADGSTGGNAVSFRVRSEQDGELYFRMISYGAYAMNSWSPARDYGAMLDETYSYNYLTGTALAAEKQPAAIEFEMLTNDYLLPYYMAMGADDGYTVQTSDVRYAGEEKTYSLAYFAYDYLTEGERSVPAGYAEAEQAYRTFVYENYLAVPESTAQDLQTIIAEQGFSGTTREIVAQVAQYVQNAAVYNLEYDRAMDKAEDIVVAFLSEFREGICQHYASAATLLYRMLGIPARYTLGYAGSVTANEWTEIGPSMAHAWVEVYIDGLGWVNVEVTGGGPGGGSGGGSFGEERYELSVKPVDKTKEYDGTPLEADAIEGADGESAALLHELKAKGYVFEPQFAGIITQVGTAESSIVSCAVYDPEGKLASNVTLSFETGTLTIVLCTVITIHPYVVQKYYDGTPLAYNADDYYVTGLPQGWQIQFSLSGISLTEAGVLDLKTLETLPVSVYDENGTKLTEESDYVVVFEGTDVMAIGKRAITIVSESDMKEYDGTPLENGGYRIASGSLVQGHTLEVEIIGSIIDIGTAYNNFGSIRILDADGNDVTDNYEIQTVRGILEVISD